MKVKYYYDIPTFNADEHGNVIIIHKYSVAPIESFTYGITKDNQYFLEWEYPMLGDDELEIDYRIITGDRLLDVLKNEINICRETRNAELVEKYVEAMEKIQAIEDRKKIN